MTAKKTIAYVGPFSFPSGGAAARRILGVSKIFQALGYDVLIGSGQVGSNCTSHDGMSVNSLNERTAESYPVFIKHLLYFSMGKKTIKWLDSLEVKPDVIVLYSGYSPYFIRLLPWCQKNGIPLVFDAVEWYDSPSWLRGLMSPYYWNIELAMRFLSARSKNIIAISRYLQSHYELKGCNIIRMPPVLDVAAVEPRLVACSGAGVVELGYTGTPGHKDLLDNVLEALLDIDINGEKFKLHIAGICEKELLTSPSLIKRGVTALPAFVCCYGVVSQARAMEIIKNVDFSVLLRPDKRFSRAGFPTKFVESFSVGTPVIANYTSDISDYLVDGENGIVCDGATKGDLIQALRQVASFDVEQRSLLRLEAHETALKYFNTASYTRELEVFIKKLIRQ